MLRENYKQYGCEDGVPVIAERWLKPRCQWSSPFVHESISRRRSSLFKGVRMTNQTLTPRSLLLLWAMVLITFSCVAADDSRAAIGLFRQQDADGALPLDYSDRVLAPEIAAQLRAKALQRMADFERSEYEPDEDEPAEPLPVPLPVFASKEDSKRGSYMSLCHFKICNMGRKRNLRLLASRNRY